MDIPINTDTFDLVAQNIVSNIGKINEFLKNCEIKSEIVDSNLNVSEILSCENGRLLGGLKSDYYEINDINEMFALFSESEAKKTNKPSLEKSQSTSQIFLNEDRSSAIEEIKQTLDKIKASLDQIKNQSIPSLNLPEIEEKARTKFMNIQQLALELDKKGKELETIVKFSGKDNVPDPFIKCDLDENFNKKIQDITKMLNSLAFLKSHENSITKTSKIVNSDSLRKDEIDMVIKAIPNKK